MGADLRGMLVDLGCTEVVLEVGAAGFDILSAVHECRGGHMSHDILLQAGLRSKHPPGLYSAEVKCREVKCKHPGGFDWAETLEESAVTRWDVERASFPEACFAGRLLVFVEMASPCHAGAPKTHGSVLLVRAQKFALLWGWAGFKSKPQTMPLPSGSSGGPPGNVSQVTVSATSATERPRATLASCASASIADSAAERKWAKVIKGKASSDGWMQVNHFLEGLALPAAHAARYVRGPGPKQWKLPNGSKPQAKIHWAYKPGRRGGGAGKGILHARLSFLKEVFVRYYTDRVA